MVAEQAEAAAQLAVTACLGVAAKPDVGALAVGDKQMVFREELVEGAKVVADAHTDQRSAVVWRW